MELYTIIAELINFSVLIFLLNKFLYKPVLKAMDKRREEIRHKIDETQRKLEESDKLKEDYLSKLKEVERENVILREQAMEDIKKFKELELQKARDDVDSKKSRFNDYLNLEQKNLVENFNENLSDVFVEYSNNVLKVLANSSLQKEIVNSFIEKLDSVTKDKVDSVNELKADTIYIISDSPLDDNNKDLIRSSLVKKGFVFEELDFAVDEKLVLGIELKAKSYIISWNVKELTNNFISNIDKKMSRKK